MWRDVDVVNLERRVIEGYGYSEVFDGVVLRVEVVGGELLVLRVMDIARCSMVLSFG